MEYKVVEAKAISFDMDCKNIFSDVSITNLVMTDRSLAWSLANKSAAEQQEILAPEIAQYNQYVTMLKEQGDFVSTFTGWISRKNLVAQWSEPFANQALDIPDVSFETPFVALEDGLLVPDMNPHCKMVVENQDIHFTIGETSDGYPSENKAGTQFFLWNWSHDSRDFTACLWNILDDYKLIPTDEDEDGEPIYDYADYECYSQGREVMEKPNANLLSCMDVLANAGYLNLYQVCCEQALPWIKYRSADGHIGFATLSKAFLEDDAILTELKQLLSRL